MADNEEIQQEVVDVPQEEPVVVKISETKEEKKERKERERSENTESPSDEREIALREMRAQYEEQKRRAEAERNARQQAEQYAYQQAQQAFRANAEAQDSNLRTIMNAIAADEQVAANAERIYADAMASGDSALAAKAQREMARIEARLLQLENGKRALEERLQTTEGRVAEPEMPRFAPQQHMDPVEAVASQLTPKSAAWIRAHPEAATQIQKLTAAHSAAVQLKGYEPESPEYFKYVEKQLGLSRGDREDKGDRKSSKSNISSAPVSSSSSMMSSRSNGSSPVAQGFA